jgi:hypothetical protein
MDAIAKQKHPMCQSRQAIGSWTAASIVAGVTALLLPAPAYSLNRCEGRDGHVTYTNEACPPNTRLARRIDTTPAIVTQEPRSAKPAEGAVARDETRTAANPSRDGKEEREDSKAAKEAAVERAAAPKEVPSERTAAPPPPRIEAGGRIQPAAAAAPANPEQEIQRLDELRLRQERQCADLNRRIQFVRADLATASGSDRASIELQLRRLEEDARAICP